VIRIFVTVKILHGINCLSCVDDLECVQQTMTEVVNHYRKRGRPATLRDKNRRPMPVRADRDRLMNWLFELLRYHPILATFCNSAETNDSLDSTTRCTTMRIGTRRLERCVASSAYHCVIWWMYGGSTTRYWELCIHRHTFPGSRPMSFTMQ